MAHPGTACQRLRPAMIPAPLRSPSDKAPFWARPIHIPRLSQFYKAHRTSSAAARNTFLRLGIVDIVFVRHHVKETRPRYFEAAILVSLGDVILYLCLRLALRP